MSRAKTDFKNSHYGFLMPLSMLFITTLLAANSAAQQPIAVFGLIMPGGTFIFPFIFILGGIFPEVYGYRWTRRMIYSAAGCSLLMAAYLRLVLMANAADFCQKDEAFDAVFRTFWLIFLVSILSFTISGLAHSFLLAKLKLFMRRHYYGCGLFHRPLSRFWLIISFFCQ